MKIKVDWVTKHCEPNIHYTVNISPRELLEQITHKEIGEILDLINLPREKSKQDKDGNPIWVKPQGLNITCDKCGKRITEQGALYFSPPDLNAQCTKNHICKECYEKDKPPPITNSLCETCQEICKATYKRTSCPLYKSVCGCGKPEKIKELDYGKLCVCDYGDTDKIIEHILTLAKKINSIIHFLDKEGK